MRPDVLARAMSLLLLLLVPSGATQEVAIGEWPHCKGHKDCRGHPTALRHLASYIEKVDNDRTFRNGEFIACVGENTLGKPVGEVFDAFCVYAERTAYGVSGRLARQLISQLRLKGCRTCGGIGTSFPSDSPHKGRLTVNFVHGQWRPCPDGLCPPNQAAIQQKAVQKHQALQQEVLDKWNEHDAIRQEDDMPVTKAAEVAAPDEG